MLVNLTTNIHIGVCLGDIFFFLALGVVLGEKKLSWEADSTRRQGLKKAHFFLVEQGECEVVLLISWEDSEHAALGTQWRP